MYLDRFVVHGLTPGDTYIFRVQAVNAYGLSEESQESAPLFIDAALGKHVAAFILKHKANVFMWVVSSLDVIYCMHVPTDFCSNVIVKNDIQSSSQ